MWQITNKCYDFRGRCRHEFVTLELDFRLFNSHGTNQDIYYGVFRCLYVESDINHVFVVPKQFDSWSKNVISGPFSVYFRWNFRRKNFFGKILLHQKIRLWISAGVSSAIFELSCFPPSSSFFLAVYCQLVTWLLRSENSKFCNKMSKFRDEIRN